MLRDHDGDNDQSDPTKGIIQLNNLDVTWSQRGEVTSYNGQGDRISIGFLPGNNSPGVKSS